MAFSYQRSGLGRFLFVMVFVALTTGFGIWQVHRQYNVISKGFGLDQALFEHHRLLERQKRLELLMASQDNPLTFEEFAEKELKMKRPERDNTLFVPALAESPLPLNKSKSPSPPKSEEVAP